MRAVIQRVKQASVTVNSEVVGKIDAGLLVLVGIAPEDGPEECQKLASKVVKARLWPDDEGAQWKKAVGDIGGKVLCVSQFTLYGTMSKGTKPDFHGASKGEHALSLFNLVKQHVANNMPNKELDVADGRFGAMMEVDLVNDGPTTIIYDTNESRKR